MIHITAAEGKYYFSDVVILTSRQSMNIDEQTLTLDQLEGLKDGYETGRLIMTSGDYTKLLTTIEDKQYGGGTAPYPELPVATKNSLGGVIVSDYLKIDTSGKLSVDFEATFNTQLNNYALKTEIPLLERTPSSNTLPVLANRVPLYSLGTDGNFVLCTPNAWIKLDENLFMPAYTGEVLGLHP